MSPIKQYITDLQNLLDRLSIERVEEVVSALHEARLGGKQVFTMGNGGSAATANHFVCDLSKSTRKAGWPAFKVIGLADNISSLTAYANDEGYERVFEQQLANLVQPGDLVIGISASGNSPNVLNAINLANNMHAKTIGFTGFNGGQLADLVDINVHVPSDCIEHIEDIHLMLEHVICKVLKEEVPQKALSTELFSALTSELAVELDLRDLLRRILQLTLDGIGASSGSIMVLNKEGNVVEGALAYGGTVQTPDNQGLSEIIERGLAGWVVENRQAALVTSTRDDPRWLPRDWDRVDGISRSAISVPLMANDRVVGVLTLVNSETGHFTKEDLALLTAITVCMSLANYAI